MVKVLLLGVGMQGKATLHDLMHSGEAVEVTAADRDVNALQAYVDAQPYARRVPCRAVDAADMQSVNRLLDLGPDVVICLLPVPFIPGVVAAAVEHGIHIVTASYATPQERQLSAAAEAKGVTVLPEFGMDPGIDLVLLGQAVRSLDKVTDIVTYGAGFPELEAADNPLKYKVTWTFEGVLRSYRRAGRVIRDGAIVEIKADQMFALANIHEVEIKGLGRLEAFPNGDALKYADLLGIPHSQLRNMGRYVLRWPGHCAFWRVMAGLHLLDDEPVVVDGVEVDRRRFLAAAIEPQIRYRPGERDVVVVRIEVKGVKDGRPTRALQQMVDRRDLTTGHTAMSRTVGYTASIGALMIASGKIARRGVLSPVNDVPYDMLVEELGKRGIRVTSELGACE